MRNQVYEKLVRQPIGFFQQQSTGRLISTVINDVERVRIVLSDSLALFFRYIFTLFFLLVVLLVTNWKMALGSVIAVAAGASGRCGNLASAFAARRKPANRISAS